MLETGFGVWGFKNNGKKSLEDDRSSSSIKLPIHGKKDGTPIFNPLSGI